MKFLKFLPFLLLIASLPAMAQIGLYSGYSASKINAPHADWISGPIVGAYGEKGHISFLTTGLDMRGAFLFGGDYTHLFNVLAGPRLAFVPRVVPLQPYAEGLVGLGHYVSGSQPQVGRGPANGTYNELEYQVIGGMDLNVAPHVDWRVVEFSYSGISGLGLSSHPRSVIMGIVVRLP